MIKLCQNHFTKNIIMFAENTLNETHLNMVSSASKRMNVSYKMLFLSLVFSVGLFAQPGKDRALTVSTTNTVLNGYSGVTTDVLAGTNTVQAIRIPLYTTLTLNPVPTFDGTDPYSLQRPGGGVLLIFTDNFINNESVNTNTAGFISAGIPSANISNSALGSDYLDVAGGLGGRPIVSAYLKNQIIYGGGGGAGYGNNSNCPKNNNRKLVSYMVSSA